MLFMFKPLDLWLLDHLFEPITRYLNKRFGWSNYWLARVILVPSVAILVLALAGYSVGYFGPPVMLFPYLIAAMYIGYTWEVLQLATKLEHEYTHPKPGAMPPNFRDPPTGSEY